MAKRFDGEKSGRELPEIDYDWTVERETENGLFLTTGTGHGFDLWADHIHNFATDPMRGEGFGFLILSSQVSMGGDKVWIEPGIRPSSH